LGLDHLVKFLEVSLLSVKWILIGVDESTGKKIAIKLERKDTKFK